MYILLILFLIYSLGMIYFSYNSIYQKIKLHNVRLKMQEQGQISKEKNITFLTFWNIVLYLLPVFKYKKVDNEEHRKKIREVNRSLLGSLLSVAIYFVVFNFCFLYIYLKQTDFRYSYRNQDLYKLLLQMIRNKPLNYS